ncbi:MAG: transposase family protein [Myxococcales bacterium]
MPNARETRRICGFVASRADRLRLDRVSDQRDPCGKRWNLPTLLWASLLGMMAGQKGFAGVESLTDDLSVPVRRRLGIKRRIPDTTLRNALATIDPTELRPVLHSVTRSASRSKSIAVDFTYPSASFRWTVSTFRFPRLMTTMPNARNVPIRVSLVASAP